MASYSCGGNGFVLLLLRQQLRVNHELIHPFTVVSWFIPDYRTPAIQLNHSSSRKVTRFTCALSLSSLIRMWSERFTLSGMISLPTSSSRSLGHGSHRRERAHAQSSGRTIVTKCR